MFGKSARIQLHIAGDAVAYITLFTVVCLCLFSIIQPAHAMLVLPDDGVVWSGDLDPDDPTTWDSNTLAYIGKDSFGSMTITDGTVINDYGYISYNSLSTGEVMVDGANSKWINDYHLSVGYGGIGDLNVINGGEVRTFRGYIGWNSGSEGEVTVDGANSTLTNDFNLWVGLYGSGFLSITDDGAVTVAEDTWVAYYPGSTGTIHFDNGTLTTAGLYCAANDLTGTGTINTRNLFSDVDLVFDATHGLSQTIYINNNPGQDISVNLSVDDSSRLVAGFRGFGTISISEGRVVESSRGFVGYESISTGEVSVNGAGSTWSNTGYLFLGHGGCGKLNVTDGGTVTNSHCYIGNGPESTGEVLVTDTGSKWATSAYLYIGRAGTGTLKIANGGVVTSLLSIIGDDPGGSGEVTIDGAGSLFTNGSGLIVGCDGNGTLNITSGGLVSVAGVLEIGRLAYGNGFINMSTGGMLALNGDVDGSLAEFLELVDGTGAIRYWDDSVAGWSDIVDATYGEDYTLSYLSEGDLAGYTVLTVGAVPEPSVIVGLVGLWVAVLWSRVGRRRGTVG